ncbi:MAG TPA: ABC transporter permease subunit [Longimicrobiales bacterium]|nr:ABC transporter permease subunit [Longimicrobiales bacterium]
MNTLKIFRYQTRDVLRNRWIPGYALFFLLISDALFRFGGDGERVILSLMNVVLLLVPLSAVMLGVMYLYSSREYIELLLTQPIRRGELFLGLFGGLALPLSAAFVVGAGLPFLYHGAAGTGAALPILLGTGVLLTVIFVALAFALALVTEDRTRGMGLALLAWMGFAVLYNGLVLLVVQLFADYPLERVVIGLSVLNPIDLGRILLLLNLDAAALMGFTGAVFERFFGGATGRAVTLAALSLWLAVPLLLGRRAFLRKNF